MRNFKVILIALLAGITIFSVFKYVAALKEKYALLNDLSKRKAELAVLEQERQNLLQQLEKEKESAKKLEEENLSLKDNLKANQENLAKLQADLDQTKAEIARLNAELVALKSERDNLSLQLTQVAEENASLKERLNSIIELKKAIRELKIRKRKIGTEIKKKIESQESLAGNYGFVIKDGRSTVQADIKIDVLPAAKE